MTAPTYVGASRTGASRTGTSQASASPAGALHVRTRQAGAAQRGMASVEAINAGAVRVGIGAVRVYQWTLRPFIGSHCRFWPSCSEYAVEALRVHGAARGTAMAANRILRCNPWHEGGVDPVPRREGNGIDRNMGH
jgi:putative membrane protein insertion efficiency factor